MTIRYFEYIGPPSGGRDGVSCNYTVGKVYETPPVQCYPEPVVYGRFLDDDGEYMFDELSLFVQVEASSE